MRVGVASRFICLQAERRLHNGAALSPGGCQLHLLLGEGGLGQPATGWTPPTVITAPAQKAEDQIRSDQCRRGPACPLAGHWHKDTKEASWRWNIWMMWACHYPRHRHRQQTSAGVCERNFPPEIDPPWFSFLPTGQSVFLFILHLVQQKQIHNSLLNPQLMPFLKTLNPNSSVVRGLQDVAKQTHSLWTNTQVHLMLIMRPRPLWQPETALRAPVGSTVSTAPPPPPPRHHNCNSCSPPSEDTLAAI